MFSLTSTLKIGLFSLVFSSVAFSESDENEVDFKGFETLLDSQVTIPAVLNETVQLGVPFNLMSGDFRYYRCINAFIDEDNSENSSMGIENLNGESSVKIYEQLTAKSIQNKLSGSLGASINSGAMDGIFSAEVGAEIAKSLASDSKTITFTFPFELKRKRAYLINKYDLANGTNLNASSYCSDLWNEANKDGANVTPELIDSLGTHILSEITYGAHLLANMKITTESTEVKKKVRVNLSLDASVVEINGDLSNISESSLRNSTVEIYLMQKGGDPRSLIKYLGTALEGDGVSSIVARCDLTDLGHCVDVFNSIVEYAQGDFAASLLDENGSLDIDKMVRLQYSLDPFKEVGFKESTIKELKHHAAVQSGDLREMLDGYKQYSLDLHKVERALGSINNRYPEGYRERLNDARDKLSYGQEMFKVAAQLCRKFYYSNECELIKNELYNSSIDPKLSVDPIESAEFHAVLNSAPLSTAEAKVEWKQPELQVQDGLPEVILKWRTYGADVSSCRIEATDINGVLIPDFPDLVAVEKDNYNEVRIPLSALLLGADPSVDMSKAKALIDCKNLLADSNQNNLEPIQLINNSTINQISESIYGSIQYLKQDGSAVASIINKENFNGVCFARARYAEYDDSDNSVLEKWSDWTSFVLDSESAEVEFSSLGEHKVYEEPDRYNYTSENKIDGDLQVKCIALLNSSKLEEMFGRQYGSSDYGLLLRNFENGSCEIRAKVEALDIGDGSKWVEWSDWLAVDLGEDDVYSFDLPRSGWIRYSFVGIQQITCDGINQIVEVNLQ